jgi:hypothetical protein
MAQKINQFRNGGWIEFDDGKFDKWCVYVTLYGQERFAPSDLHYFTRLKNLGDIHSHRKIYDDFVVIFNRTGTDINSVILSLIKVLSESYGNDTFEMEIWFNVLYAGMVAEENKRNAVLKKRIKRLGIHQILIDKMEPADAVVFSKGKKWWELDKIMIEKGF